MRNRKRNPRRRKRAQESDREGVPRRHMSARQVTASYWSDVDAIADLIESHLPASGDATNEAYGMLESVAGQLEQRGYQLAYGLPLEW